ncbi:hypothetical protein JFX23_00790 [Schaalia cardiffensis]|uniref:hypothetical protein n=1 Tax=Schaalia cardiffensis TaxID=181487 RepID=UPI0018E87125|nr:hypothetical protein [Schaalia cardiffensis]MBJ2328315.1 hypothetical protein [Schaalia cardiffensis]
MLEGFIVIFFMLAVMLTAAVGVIVGLALVRRPAQAWQEHLKEQNAQFAAEEAPKHDELVGVKQTTLRDLIERNTTERNAYFDADRLPGVERIEAVTERFEAMHPARKNTEES